MVGVEHAGEGINGRCLYACAALNANPNQFQKKTQTHITMRTLSSFISKARGHFPSILLRRAPPPAPHHHVTPEKKMPFSFTTFFAPLLLNTLSTFSLHCFLSCFHIYTIRWTFIIDSFQNLAFLTCQWKTTDLLRIVQLKSSIKLVRLEIFGNKV